MRKMKLAMLIVFCVMLFGGTVVSFVLPDREFSDVENRELAKKPKITAKRILSGEYQKEYDTLPLGKKTLMAFILEKIITCLKNTKRRILIQGR